MWRFIGIFYSCPLDHGFVTIFYAAPQSAITVSGQFTKNSGLGLQKMKMTLSELLLLMKCQDFNYDGRGSSHPIYTRIETVGPEIFLINTLLTLTINPWLTFAFTRNVCSSPLPGINRLQWKHITILWPGQILGLPIGLSDTTNPVDYIYLTKKSCRNLELKYWR